MPVSQYPTPPTGTSNPSGNNKIFNGGPPSEIINPLFHTDYQGNKRIITNRWWSSNVWDPINGNYAPKSMCIRFRQVENDGSIISRVLIVPLRVVSTLVTPPGVTEGSSFGNFVKGLSQTAGAQGRWGFDDFNGVGNSDFYSLWISTDYTLPSSVFQYTSGYSHAFQYQPVVAYDIRLNAWVIAAIRKQKKTIYRCDEGEFGAVTFPQDGYWTYGPPNCQNGCWTPPSNRYYLFYGSFPTTQVPGITIIDSQTLGGTFNPLIDRWIVGKVLWQSNPGSVRIISDLSWLESKYGMLRQRWLDAFPRSQDTSTGALGALGLSLGGVLLP